MNVNSKYAPGAQVNICFECRNALGGCNWSKNFEPVPGWTAKPVTKMESGIPAYETYHITACPEFVPG